MPWDENLNEWFDGPRDRKQTIQCVKCGETFDPDYGDYVLIGDEPVCSGQGYTHGHKCKWEYIDEQFAGYIKSHDVLNRLNAIIANPNLDAIIALRKELADFGKDETGSDDTTNLVSSVLGPLYDAEDVLKRGLTDYLPECLEDAKKGVEAILAK